MLTLAANPARAWFLENLPRSVALKVYERYLAETRRVEREVRLVARDEILRMLRGEVAGINPRAVLEVIGLTPRQKETIDRARARMQKEGKTRAAIEKELSTFRSKLLKERAKLIAEHETRVAEAFGQQAAWERMIADGEITRDYHKLWTIHPEETASGVCPVCEEMEESELPLDELFETDYGEVEGPPIHPWCACRLVLVKPERHVYFDEEQEEPDDEAIEGLAFGSRLDPRIPNIFNPAAGGQMPRRVARRGLGPLKPNLAGSRPTQVGGKHPGRVDRPSLRKDEDAEGHWVQINGHPVFIKGPRPIKEPRGQAAAADAAARIAAARAAGQPAVASPPSGSTPEPDVNAPKRPDFIDPRKWEELNDLEYKLMTMPIVEKQPLGDGINGGYRVKFADGSYGIFKPVMNERTDVGSARGTPVNATRECAAIEIANVMGMSKLTGGAAVLRSVDSLGPGALIAMAPGRPAGGVGFDGEQNAAKIAMFDLAIGNGDRHGNNWIDEPPHSGHAEHVYAIDHGYSFSTQFDYPGFNPSEFIRYEGVREVRGRAVTPPQQLAQQWAANRPKIDAILTKWGIEPQAIKLFDKRVAKLQNVTTWKSAWELHIQGIRKFDRAERARRHM